MQDYSINTNQPFIEVEQPQQKGPRATFVDVNLISTKIEIQKIITQGVMNHFLETLLNTNTETFTEKYITIIGQEALNQLDERTTILFKNIIYYVVNDHTPWLGKLNELCGNDNILRGMYIKEAALPSVLRLVQKFDEFDKDLLNEVNSIGIEPEIASYLKTYGIF